MRTTDSDSQYRLDSTIILFTKATSPPSHQSSESVPPKLFGDALELIIVGEPTTSSFGITLPPFPLLALPFFFDFDYPRSFRAFLAWNASLLE